VGEAPGAADDELVVDRRAAEMQVEVALQVGAALEGVGAL